MNREIPYEENEKCDVCGQEGAFDFMGDFVCAKCLAKIRHEQRILKNEQKQKTKPDKEQRN